MYSLDDAYRLVRYNHEFGLLPIQTAKGFDIKLHQPLLTFRGDIMTYFLITFAVMLIVIAIMAIGVIFGRRAIKGSCGGGMNKAECVCVEKCDKRKKMEAEANLTQG